MIQLNKRIEYRRFKTPNIVTNKGTLHSEVSAFFFDFTINSSLGVSFVIGFRPINSSSENSTFSKSGTFKFNKNESSFSYRPENDQNYEISGTIKIISIGTHYGGFSNGSRNFFFDKIKYGETGFPPFILGGVYHLEKIQAEDLINAEDLICPSNRDSSNDNNKLLNSDGLGASKESFNKLINEEKEIVTDNENLVNANNSSKINTSNTGHFIDDDGNDITHSDGFIEYDRSEKMNEPIIKKEEEIIGNNDDFIDKN